MTDHTNETVINELADEYTKILNYLGKGGSFKNLAGLSDEALESMYSIAYSMYQYARYGEAAEMFRMLCFYDSLCKKYLLGYGSCLQMLKNYKKAMELFAICNMLDNSDPRPYLYMGDCIVASSNNVTEAMECYEQAEKLADNSADYVLEYKRAKSMLEHLSDKH